MNAQNSLLDNFSNMHDEFNSSNNLMTRGLDEIFVTSVSDLRDSLDYFNGEYLVLDKRILNTLMDGLKKNLLDSKIAHVLKYIDNFSKEANILRQTMCNFFILKLAKGDNTKKKMSSGVKKIIDRMCDFNFIEFEERIRGIIYQFKIAFENEYVRDEYCKDDFNKIVRSMEHSLIDDLRSKVAESIIAIQEIISRYTTRGYEIIDAFKALKR